MSQQRTVVVTDRNGRQRRLVISVTPSEKQTPVPPGTVNALIGLLFAGMTMLNGAFSVLAMGDGQVTASSMFVFAFLLVLQCALAIVLKVMWSHED